jgi:hypothetical protein
VSPRALGVLREGGSVHHKLVPVILVLKGAQSAAGRAQEGVREVFQ